MQQIGVFGASFNPPTCGHQDVINQALTYFDEVLLVPSLSHPFQKSLAPIEHRLAMLRIFLSHWHPQPAGKIVKIFNVESVVQAMHPGKEPIYTYDVLSTLNTLYMANQKPFQLRFIIGPDNASPKVWKKFYRFDEIEKNWPLFIAKEHIPIHSTLVKETILQLAQDEQALEKALVPLVGEGIARYIIAHHLYSNKGLNDG